MKNAIDQLAQKIFEVPHMLSQISDQSFEYKPSENKWSKKEILGHLIDSALNNMLRFVRIQYEDTPKITYDQDEWVKIQSYQNADRHKLVSLWKNLNLQILHIWKNMPAEKLKKKCDTGKNVAEIQDLKFLISDYNCHLQHHLDRIFQHREK